MISELCNRTAVRLLRNHSQIADPEKREPVFGRPSTQTGNPPLAYGAMEKGTKVYKIEEMCGTCARAHVQEVRGLVLHYFSLLDAKHSLSATSVWYSYYHEQQIKSTTA